MNPRITRTELNFSIIALIRKRATCRRAQVGALLTKKNRIICTGYNGPEKGHLHCIEANCNLEESCKIAIHAEANVILFCKRNNIRTKNTRLWCSTAPCINCAKMIVEAGIKEVNYYIDYRESKGIELLLSFGIKVNKHEYKESV